jgi:hypothetical protein
MSNSTTSAPAANAAAMEGVVFSRYACRGGSIRRAVQVSFSRPSRWKVWCTPRWEMMSGGAVRGGTRRGMK